MLLVETWQVFKTYQVLGKALVFSRYNSIEA